MKQLKNYLIIFIITCFIPSFSWAAIPSDSIILSEGRLSVKLREAPFKEVMKILSEKTGTHIYIFDDKDNEKLTIEFSDRSLELGMRMILKNVNHAIVYQNEMNNGYVTWAVGTSGNGKRYYERPPSGIFNGIKSNVSSTADKKDYKVRSVTTVGPGAAGILSIPNNISDKNIENYTSQTTKGSNNIVYNYVAGRRSDSLESSKSEAANLDTANTNEPESLSNFESYGNKTGELHDVDDVSDYSSEKSDEIVQTYKSNDIPSWYYEGMPKGEGKLRYKIDILENQIESGSAERDYQLRVSLRGEKSVLTPEEELENYYTRLEEMSGNY